MRKGAFRPAEHLHSASPAPAGRGEASSPFVALLEKLDWVIHDFMASLVQRDLHGAGKGAGSEHVARLVRILQYAPPTNTPVLGPPVLCGVSPPMGIESLLGLLGSLRRTGILRIQADDTTFMISVVQGDVVNGMSTPRPESELLGNILVARGVLKAGDLVGFFKEYGSSAFKIGDAINRQKLVHMSELRAALEHQMQKLFDRLLATRKSEWCFHDGEATLSYINMRMNVTSVLLESARKHDERLGSG